MMVLCASGGQACEAAVPQDGPGMAAGVPQAKPGRSKSAAGDGTTEAAIESGAFMMLLAQMMPGENAAGDVDPGVTVGVTEGVSQAAAGATPVAGVPTNGAATPGADAAQGVAWSSADPRPSGLAELAADGAVAASQQDTAGRVNDENSVVGGETSRVEVQDATAGPAPVPRHAAPVAGQGGTAIAARQVAGDEVLHEDDQAPDAATAAGLTAEIRYQDDAAAVEEPAEMRRTAPVVGPETGGSSGGPESTLVRTGGKAPERIDGVEPEAGPVRPKKGLAKAPVGNAVETGNEERFAPEIGSAGVHGQSGSPAAVSSAREVTRTGDTGLKGTLEPREVMRQIVDQARVLNFPDRTEVKIRLKPESLGRVDLKVSFENGRLTARFVVSDPEVKDAIESRMDDLRHGLASHGLDVRELNVSLGGDGRTFDGRERQEGWSSQPAGDPRPAADSSGSTWRVASPQWLPQKQGSIDLIA